MRQMPYTFLLRKMLVFVLVFLTSRAELSAFDFNLSGRLIHASNNTPASFYPVTITHNLSETSIQIHTNENGEFERGFTFFKKTEIKVIVHSECTYSTEHDTLIITASEEGSYHAEIQLCNTDEQLSAAFNAEPETKTRSLRLLPNTPDAFNRFVWQFEDSIFSLKENPTVSFPVDTAGVIKLTAYKQSNAYIFQDNFIIDGNSSLSGTVNIGGSPLESGNVFLINSDKSILSINKIDTVNSGNMSINDIPEGMYGLFIVPDYEFNFLHFPHYIPTYSGNSYKWSEMQPADLNQNLDNYSIDLISYPYPYYGDCSIQGTFYPSDTTQKNRELYILLLNAEKTPLDYRKIREQDDYFYSFRNLPEGKYYLHPEGLNRTTVEREVNLNTQAPGSEIDFTFSADSISPREEGRIGVALSDINITIYQKQISINIGNSPNRKFIIELYDISGKLVEQKILPQSEYKHRIDARNLASGMYFLSFVRTGTLQRETVKIVLED